MIKKFNLYVNESLTDKMKPKSEEDILSSIKNMKPKEILKKGVEFGFLFLVKIAEERGANIHIDNDLSLRLAAENGHLDIVKYLVEQSADIHKVNNSALQSAAQNGHLDVVKYLVEQSANIHANNDGAIQVAAENGHLDVVKYLVEQGADIHANSDSALRWAAANGHLYVVKYLVEQGADIHTGDDIALHYAAENDQSDVVDYLKKQMGLNEGLTDKMRPKSKEEISKFSKNLKPGDKLLLGCSKGILWLVEEAIKEGADINRAGSYALELSISYNHIHIIKYLLENGSYIHKHLLDQAKDISEENGNTEIYELLLKYSKSNESLTDKMKPKSEEDILKYFNSLDQYKLDRMLISFVRKQEINMIKLLLKNGANPNTKDKDNTVLFIAVIGGITTKPSTEIVELLLKNGADPTISNARGIDILKWAKHWGKSDMVELLKKYMKVEESLTDKMKPKSEDDIKTALKKLSPDKQLDIGKKYNDSTIIELAQKHIKLINACISGQIDIVKELINNGTQIDIKDEKDNSPLKLASENGHLDIIKLLVDNGADINIEKNGMTPLYFASYNGHLDIVKYLFENGAKLNVKNENDWNPLHVASSKGHLDVVKYLIENGMNVNEPLYNNWTPLHWASYNGNLDVVKFLIKKGANVNTASFSKETPLVCAALGKHFDIVRYLLDHQTKVNEGLRDKMKPKSDSDIRKGTDKLTLNQKLIKSVKNGIYWLAKEAIEEGADVNFFNDVCIQTAVHNEGNLELMKLLIDYGANVYINDDYPLRYASENGYLEIVKLLLDNGANPNAYNNYAIDMAKENGHTEIYELLLKYSKSNEGLTNLMKPKTDKEILSSIKNMEPNEILKKGAKYGSLMLVKIGLERGADINNYIQWSLKYATIGGYLDIVKYLVENGANIHADEEYYDGIDTLQIAAEKGHLDIVKYLVEQGADINYHHSKAFRNAAEEGHLDVVKYLVEKGANIHVSNDYAFRWAAHNGHLNVVKYLVEQGADIHAENDDALRLATENGHLDVVNYLKKEMGLNEGLTNLMKPKSKEEIKKSVDKLNPIDKINFINSYKIENLYTTEELIPIINKIIIDNYSNKNVFINDKLEIKFNVGDLNKMMKYGNGIYIHMMNSRYYIELKEYLWEKNISFSQITSTEYKIMSHDKINLVLHKLIYDVLTGKNDKFIIRKFNNLSR